MYLTNYILTLVCGMVVMLVRARVLLLVLVLDFLLQSGVCLQVNASLLLVLACTDCLGPSPAD
jgi:hypothetical protein